jgi:hypothetical protein
MTAPKSLDDSERKELLSDLTSLKSDDDDAVEQDPKWFLPLDAHERALRLETLVVRGGRGAGKSSLFHFLGHVRKQPALGLTIGVFSAAPTTWLEGFSGSVEHPSLEVVGAFGTTAKDDRRRFFWFAWLCARLSSGMDTPLPQGLLASMLPVHEPGRLADAAERQLPGLSAWLDAFERRQTAPVVLTYDALDRIGNESTVRGRMTESLLAMWLSLADRYRRIRPKIFVREDLFQTSLSAFPDASKLDARSVSIEWRVEDLYRVLIKHMANISDHVRRWVEGSTRGITLNYADALGWMPPAALPETGRGSQKAFVDHLAGEQVGSGAKKGLTYRWIPNRLQDAHARAVPRSILSLVRNAAALAVERGPEAQSLRLLTPSELQGALEKTSKRRANELREEFPVVQRLENLRGSTVMLARKRAVEALSRPTRIEDEHGADGEQVLRTLIELGAMSERSDGRIDVPDIYRYGFGILRRGGVKRPR